MTAAHRRVTASVILSHAVRIDCSMLDMGCSIGSASEETGGRKLSLASLVATEFINNRNVSRTRCLSNHAFD